MKGKYEAGVYFCTLLLLGRLQNKTRIEWQILGFDPVKTVLTKTTAYHKKLNYMLFTLTTSGKESDSTTMI